MNDSTRPLRLLSLDNGGTGALTSLYILLRLMDAIREINGVHDIQPWQVFDLIGGSGVGGLLALMLGRLRMSVQECIDEYLEMSRVAFTPKPRNFFKGSQKYDEAAFEKKLKGIVGKRSSPDAPLLDEPDSPCKVYVEDFVQHAIPANTDTLALWLSAPPYPQPAQPSWHHMSAHDTGPSLPQCRIWEAARATAAAPLLFSSINVAGTEFIDDLLSTNPIIHVFQEAQNLWQDRVENAILVSIGPGSVPSPSLKIAYRDIVSQLQAVATESERVAESFRRDHISMASSGQYYRFNLENIPLSSGLEEYRGSSQIEAATLDYLAGPETRASFKRCSEYLARPTAIQTIRTNKPLEREARKPRQDLEAILHHPMFSHPYGAKPRPISSPSTSNWIFQDRLYKMWLESRSSVLWLSGKPGAGKTQLCLFLSQKPEALLPLTDESTGEPSQPLVLSFFCTRVGGPENGVQAIFAGILYQLIRHNPEILSEVNPSLLSSKPDLLQACHLALAAALQDSSVRGVTIILDGLDECGSSSTRAVLRNIESLLKRREGPGVSFLRVLIASRPTEDIWHWMSDVGPRQVLKVHLMLEHSQNLSDIEQYIDDELQREEYGFLPPHFRHLISKRLVEKSNGIFLWAQLALERLRQERGKNPIDTLLELPASLTDIYDDILEKLGSEKRDDAISLLKWVVTAKRPLTLAELAEALRPGQNRLSSAEEREIMRALANLCIITDETVLLSHASVQDYVANRLIDQKAAELEIADQCFEYLSDGTWIQSSLYPGTDDPTTNAVDFEAFPFLQYATYYWPEHAKALDSPSEKSRQYDSKFYTHQSPQRAKWYELYDHDRLLNGREKLYFPAASPDSFTSQHLAAYLGFKWLTEILAREGGESVHATDSRGRTPLAYASYFGHISVAHCLVGLGSDVNVMDDSGYSLLHLSVAGDNFDIAEMLLGCDINPMFRSKTGDTALHIAAREGQLAIAELLVYDPRTDVNCTNENHSTPLHEACREGHAAMVDLLLQLRADPEAVDDRGRTPVHVAASNGHEHAINYLLQAVPKHDTYISLVDSEGQTPLTAAIIGGHKRVAEMIQSVMPEHSQSPTGPDVSQMIHEPCAYIAALLGDSDGKSLTLEIEVHWEVLKFMDEELLEGQGLPKLLTLSGTSSRAAAKQCSEYMIAVWPETGSQTLQVLNSALMLSRNSPKSPSRLAWSGTFFLDVALHPGDPSSGSFEKAIVGVSGTKAQVVQVAQQIAWFAAVFRLPLRDHLGYSTLRIHKRKTSGENCAILEMRLQQSTNEEPGGTSNSTDNCWNPLFRNAVIAYGFLLPERNSQSGLDVSHEVMTALAGIETTVELRSAGTILVGSKFIIYPTKVGPGFIQWHLVSRDPGQDLTEVIDDYRIPGLKLPSRFRSMKAFLGFCRFAEVVVGTAVLNGIEIRPSSAGEEKWSLSIKDNAFTASLNLSVAAAGHANIGGGFSTTAQFTRGLRTTEDDNFGGIKGRLKTAKKSAVIVYDVGCRIGWLVPELSVAIWLTHGFIRKRLELEMESADETARIKSLLDRMHAEPLSDGTAAASDVIRQYEKEPLWVDKENNDQQVIFIDVIRYILGCFDKRKRTLMESQERIRLSSKKESLYGWEASEIVDEVGSQTGSRRKEVTIPTKFLDLSSPALCRMSTDPKLLVLFSTKFGELIRPAHGSQTCREWRHVPESHDFLVASTPCLLQLGYNNGCYSDEEKFILSGQLGWNAPRVLSRMYDCGNRGCNFVQKIISAPKIFGSLSGLRYEAGEGAIVFGDRSEFHPPRSCCPETVNHNPTTLGLPNPNAVLGSTPPVSFTSRPAPTTKAPIPPSPNLAPIPADTAPVLNSTTSDHPTTTLSSASGLPFDPTPATPPISSSNAIATSSSAAGDAASPSTHVRLPLTFFIFYFIYILAIYDGDLLSPAPSRCSAGPQTGSVSPIL